MSLFLRDKLMIADYIYKKNQKYDKKVLAAPIIYAIYKT